MTSSHIFYIPLMLLAGAILGFVMGRRSVAAEQAHAKARDERRARRRARIAEESEESS
jgi:hypothetical protein